MTHDEAVAEILARAKQRGVLAHYCGRATRCQGHRGAPDIRLVGHFHAADIEVKMPMDRLEPDQTTWRHALLACGQIHYVVGPEALDNGVIFQILDYLATGQPRVA